jgi:hypothetical protein
MMYDATVRAWLGRTTLLLVTATFVAACGGSTEPKTPPKDVTPATITAASTDTVRGVAGQAAATKLTVTVKNKAGEPVDTALVTFAVTSGGGSINPTSLRTDATGQASVTWTLGQTAGVQTATATAGTLAPVTFVATASAGAAANITKVAGDAQSAPINTTVAVAPSVKITDAFGNPIVGQVVNFTVGSGGGLANGGTVNTNAQGIATITSWRLGSTVGTNTLVATAGNLSTTFTATATVGAAATITLAPTNPGQLAVGQTVTLTARVTDASGNVIANPSVAYTTSNSAVASVSSTGVVTAVGPGTATITATSGAANASVAITVIGHPAGTTITNTIQLGAFPGDVAFTNNAMLISASGVQQILVFDPTGSTATGVVALSTPAPILLAPKNASGPAVAVNIGTTSRLWFINPASAAVTDSLDIPDIIQAAAINSTGTRVYSLLSGGSLSVVDATTHAEITRIALGGGVTKLLAAPGDTLLYALTNVGVMFQVDTRTNTARQVITSVTANATDIALSRDGSKFYILDAANNLVKIVDIASGSTLRTIGVSNNGTSLAVSPDDQQIWVTHSNPTRVTIYTGSLADGYRSSGDISTNSSLPLRIYFSPSGSLAAITNFGGWVDIVR